MCIREKQNNPDPGSARHISLKPRRSLSRYGGDQRGERRAEVSLCLDLFYVMEMVFTFTQKWKKWFLSSDWNVLLFVGDW